MKADFYDFVYNLWITEMPGNAALAADADLKSTFMNGGYYRVDIDSSLSVLILNSQYYDIDDDTQYQADEST